MPLGILFWLGSSFAVSSAMAAPPVAPPAATAPEALSPAQLRAMQTRTLEGFKKESLVTIVTNVFVDHQYQGYGLGGNSGNSLQLTWIENKGAGPTDKVFHHLQATFDEISEKTIEVRLMLTKDYFLIRGRIPQLIQGEPETASYHKIFFDAIRVEIERRKALGRN
jgi:hypothetical protein